MDLQLGGGGRFRVPPRVISALMLRFIMGSLRVQVIMEYVGRDATAGFEGVGHSKAARGMLAGFRVGVVTAEDVI